MLSKISLKYKTTRLFVALEGQGSFALGSFFYLAPPVQPIRKGGVEALARMTPPPSS